MSCSQFDPYCVKCQNLTNGGDPAAYSNQGFNCLQCSLGYVLNNSICATSLPLKGMLKCYEGAISAKVNKCYKIVKSSSLK